MKKLNGKFVCFLLLSFVFSFLACCETYTNKQNSLNNNTQIEEKKIQYYKRNSHLYC